MRSWTVGVLLWVAGLLPLVSLGVVEAPKRSDKARPNVVLIMTDDQGYANLGCHGHPFIKTPSLDKLYNESIRLTDFHVSPVCMPTRASLMTGRHCRHVGVSGTSAGKEVLKKGVPTMADLFAQNGYRTGLFGKWHLGDHYPYRPNDRGFQESITFGSGAISTGADQFGNDYFDDRYVHNGKVKQYQGFCSDVWFDNAQRFIKASKESDQPFFCYIVPNVVHGPHYAPKEYVDMYRGKRGKAAYFGGITHLDQRVGALRAFLQELGLADNTVFIFTSDNGATIAGTNIYDAGLRGTKHTPYDGGNRVPFFIYWPDGALIGGRDVSEQSAHIDVLPSLVEVCGLQANSDYKPDGLSLASVLSGASKGLGNRTLVESFFGVAMTPRWRLIQWAFINGEGVGKRKKAGDATELYDMTQDPGQKDNVADANPEVVSSLKAALDKVTQGDDKGRHQFIIGSDHENPVNFTPFDWNNKLGLGHWQSEIIAGKGKLGSLTVEVEQAGTYQFSLRRWPRSVNQPIASPATVLVPSNDVGGTRQQQGKSLPVTAAHLNVDAFDKTIRVTKDMTEAVFTLPLEEGLCTIRAEFSDGPGKHYPVYYLEVERL